MKTDVHQKTVKTSAEESEVSVTLIVPKFAHRGAEPVSK